MKVMIMKCARKDYWYRDKIGKQFKVDGLSWPNKDYITKQGIIKRSDAVEV